MSFVRPARTWPQPANAVAPQEQPAPAKRGHEDDDEGLDFGQILRIFQRRQRLLVVTFAGVSLLVFSAAVVQRLTSPVFEGRFTILVSDPVNPTSQGGGVGAESNASLGAVALSRPQQEIGRAHV